MGYRGWVCEFDHRRFVEVVVPAFRAGEDHPLISGAIDLIDAADPHPPAHAFEGLAGVLAHFDDQLTSSDLGKGFHVVDGRLTSAPGEGSGWGYDDLCDLFHWVVLREAVVGYANLSKVGQDMWDLFLGRYPHDPTYVDDPPLTLETMRLHELLLDLDHSHHAWRGYWQYGGSGEGICGWLGPADTRELATLLPAPSAPHPLERGCQVCVRGFLDRAVAEGNGLLWGRSLMLDTFADELFADGKPRPLRYDWTPVEV